MVQITHEEVVAISAHFLKVVEPVGEAFGLWALWNLEMGCETGDYYDYVRATKWSHEQKGLGDTDTLLHEEHPDGPAIDSPHEVSPLDPGITSLQAQENSDEPDHSSLGGSDNALEDSMEDSMSDSSSEAEIPGLTRV